MYCSHLALIWILNDQITELNADVKAVWTEWKHIQIQWQITFRGGLRFIEHNVFPGSAELLYTSVYLLIQLPKSFKNI